MKPLLCLYAALTFLLHGTVYGPPVQAAQTKQAPSEVEGVKASHWAYGAVRELFQRKLMRGYPENYFDGKPLRTRFEFAIATVRILKTQWQYDKSVAQGIVEDAGAQAENKARAEATPLLKKLIREFYWEVVAISYDVSTEPTLRARVQKVVVFTKDMESYRMLVELRDKGMGYFGPLPFDNTVRTSASSPLSGFLSELEIVRILKVMLDALPRRPNEDYGLNATHATIREELPNLRSLARVYREELNQLGLPETEIERRLYALTKTVYPGPATPSR